MEPIFMWCGNCCSVFVLSLHPERGNKGTPLGLAGLNLIKTKSSESCQFRDAVRKELGNRVTPLSLAGLNLIKTKCSKQSAHLNQGGKRHLRHSAIKNLS